MFVSYTHESIRLTGRWDKSEKAATATTAGAYVEFCFEGNMAVARFDTETNFFPPLHIWIQIDGGDMTEAAIDRFLRIQTKDSGLHVCRIIYKGSTEEARRWTAPLAGKVTFLGVQTDKPVAIAPDERPTVEFVGDSITEGVGIDMDYFEGGEPAYLLDQLNRPHQDDACATYAWLTAEALNLRPIIMGYGAVGTTKAGCGGVPKAQEAYPYNFEGSPITHPSADLIVINHGANDRKKGAEEYVAGYRVLLDVIRERNPHSEIVALSPFCGAFISELGELVESYNRERGDRIHFINGGEWISPDPLHPTREGHRTVAEHLAPLLGEILKNK